MVWSQPCEIRPCQRSETTWFEDDKSRQMMRQTDVYVSNCRVSLDFPNMLRLLFTKHDSLKLRQLRYNKIQLQCCHCALDGMWCNVMLWCDVVRNDVMWCDVTPRDRLNEMRERRERQRRQVDHHDVSPHTGVVLYSAPGWPRYRVCIVLWSGENSARFSVYLQWWQALE